MLQTLLYYLKLYRTNETQLWRALEYDRLRYLGHYMPRLMAAVILLMADSKRNYLAVSNLVEFLFIMLDTHLFDEPLLFKSFCVHSNMESFPSYLIWCAFTLRINILSSNYSHLKSLIFQSVDYLISF